MNSYIIWKKNEFVSRWFWLNFWWFHLFLFLIISKFKKKKIFFRFNYNSTFHIYYIVGGEIQSSNCSKHNSIDRFGNIIDHHHMEIFIIIIIIILWLLLLLLFFFIVDLIEFRVFFLVEKKFISRKHNTIYRFWMKIITTKKFEL
mgnify:CR=1 FL=1